MRLTREQRGDLDRLVDDTSFLPLEDREALSNALADLDDLTRPQSRPWSPIKDAKLAEALNKGDKVAARRAFEDRFDLPPGSLEPHRKMREAELVYLRETGWVENGPEDWSHEGHKREHLKQGHAVNVQKQFDRRWFPELVKNEVSMGCMVPHVICPLCPKGGCTHKSRT